MCDKRDSLGMWELNAIVRLRHWRSPAVDPVFFDRSAWPPSGQLSQQSFQWATSVAESLTRGETKVSSSFCMICFTSENFLTSTAAYTLHWKPWPQTLRVKALKNPPKHRPDNIRHESPAVFSLKILTKASLHAIQLPQALTSRLEIFLQQALSPWQSDAAYPVGPPNLRQNLACFLEHNSETPYFQVRVHWPVHDRAGTETVPGLGRSK